MTTDLGFRTVLTVPYDAAIEKVTAALKGEGFGVITEIDVKATLKNKLDIDFRRYAILGACNPKLAHQALQSNLEIGLMLPCNVIVYELDDGGTAVSIINPMTMLSVADADALPDVADEATARLTRVLRALN